MNLPEAGHVPQQEPGLRAGAKGSTPLPVVESPEALLSLIERLDVLCDGYMERITCNEATALSLKLDSRFASEARRVCRQLSELRLEEGVPSCSPGDSSLGAAALFQTAQFPVSTTLKFGFEAMLLPFGSSPEVQAFLSLLQPGVRGWDRPAGLPHRAFSPSLPKPPLPVAKIPRPKR